MRGEQEKRISRTWINSISHCHYIMLLSRVALNPHLHFLFISRQMKSGVCSGQAEIYSACWQAAKCRLSSSIWTWKDSVGKEGGILISVDFGLHQHKCVWLCSGLCFSPSLLTRPCLSSPGRCTCRLLSIRWTC